MFTVTELQEFYDGAKEAYLNAQTNKSHTNRDQTKVNQELKVLKDEMMSWKIQLEKAKGNVSKVRVHRIIPNA